jgi:hypothetical protein
MALRGKMGRVREVLMKAKEFIVGFAKGLKESEVSGRWTVWAKVRFLG